MAAKVIEIVRAKRAIHAHEDAAARARAVLGSEAFERLRLEVTSLRAAERRASATSEREAVRCVGRGIDWMTIAFRVELRDDVLRELGVRAAVAEEHGSASFRVEGWEACVRAPSGGRYFLGNDGERVVVWPKAPGSDAVDAGANIEAPDAAARNAEALIAGWTVAVDVSGVALLTLGWEGAVDRAWAIARRFGVVHEARVRRLDLRADFLNFPLDPDDTGRMVRRARSRPAVYGGELVPGGLRVPQITEEIDPSDHRFTTYTLARNTTGIVVGAGGAISARLYDKTFELGMQVAQAKKKPMKLLTACEARIKANAKRAAWAASWAPNGWALGQDVTRVEFQVMGQALAELEAKDESGKAVAENARCTVRGPVRPFLFKKAPPLRQVMRDHRGRKLDEPEALGAYAREALPAWCGKEAQKAAIRRLLDPLWQYLTRSWLRVAIPSGPRPTRWPTDARWIAAQAVTFERTGAPECSRQRVRSAARAGQAQGAMLAIVASRNELRELTRTEITSDGELVERSIEGQEKDWAKGVNDPDAVLCNLLEELAPKAARAIADETIRLRGAREALEHLAVKWGAARARFALARTEAIGDEPERGEIEAEQLALAV